MTQTKRHSFIVSLLGIKHVIVAINKMDLVDFSEEVYEQIKEDYQAFSARLEMSDVHFIPITALHGDNVVNPSENMPWYQGSTLMHLLENVYIGSDRNLIDFRLPVQLVNRPHLDFRGFCGTIASGVIRKGDAITVLPSKKTTRVKSIVTYEGEMEEAYAPLSVTLTFADEVDASRGDMIVPPGNLPHVDKKFEAMIVWMNESALTPGKEYLFKHTSKVTTGSISTLRYQIDVNTLHRSPAPTLKLNAIGRCQVTLTQPICFDGYARNRMTGSFIIIDRITNATMGAGMILDRNMAERFGDHWDDRPASELLHHEASKVTAQERSARFGQSPATVLLTGLTGAGKSTIAYALERKLFDAGRAVTVLDGQNMRLGISKDLGFSATERSENLRRSAEVAKMLNDSGLICVAAFLAPEEAVRQRAAEVIGRERFLVVHLSAPIEVCRQRDTEGYYKLADDGSFTDVPGVSAPYEAPTKPDLILATHELSVEECVSRILKLLEERGVAA
jgi:bifunctional enzyme CysN/CysC